MAKKTTTSKPMVTPVVSTEAFKTFFVDELKDIYWAEKALLKALPKMQKASKSPELSQAFTDHLTQTKEHVARLEKAFALFDKKPQAKKCDAMAGIIEEANGLIEDTKNDDSIRDVALILGAQKVEHYEIATYGGLVNLAQTLGNNKVATLLQQTLDEEKKADEILSSIATGGLNKSAAVDMNGEAEEYSSVNLEKKKK